MKAILVITFLALEWQKRHSNRGRGCMPSSSSSRIERERELRREGEKSLLAYLKGVDPYLI